MRNETKRNQPPALGPNRGNRFAETEYAKDISWTLKRIGSYFAKEKKLIFASSFSRKMIQQRNLFLLGSNNKKRSIRYFSLVLFPQDPHQPSAFSKSQSSVNPSGLLPGTCYVYPVKVSASAKS